MKWVSHNFITEIWNEKEKKKRKSTVWLISWSTPTWNLKRCNDKQSAHYIITIVIIVMVYQHIPPNHIPTMSSLPPSFEPPRSSAQGMAVVKVAMDVRLLTEPVHLQYHHHGHHLHQCHHHGHHPHNHLRHQYDITIMQSYLLVGHIGIHFSITLPSPHEPGKKKLPNA